MKVLVCGSRNYGLTRAEHDKICAKLDELSEGWPKHTIPNEPNWLPNVTIISGGAKGVDRCAEDWAIVNWCDCKIFPADWQKYGRAAGPIRNKQMLDEGKPDLVVAFPKGDLSKTKGTRNMVAQATERGIEVLVITTETQ